MYECREYNIDTLKKTQQQQQKIGLKNEIERDFYQLESLYIHTLTQKYKVGTHNFKLLSPPSLLISRNEKTKLKWYGAGGGNRVFCPYFFFLLCQHAHKAALFWQVNAISRPECVFIYIFFFYFIKRVANALILPTKIIELAAHEWLSQMERVADGGEDTRHNLSLSNSNNIKSTVWNECTQVVARYEILQHEVKFLIFKWTKEGRQKSIHKKKMLMVKMVKTYTKVMYGTFFVFFSHLLFDSVIQKLKNCFIGSFGPLLNSSLIPIQKKNMHAYTDTLSWWNGFTQWIALK